MKLDTSEKSVSRYEYIETRLLWSDGITAGDLAKTFDICRQAAQKVIDDYRRLYPGQMEYDRSRKRHVATDGFEPVFIRKDPLLFLDYLRGQSMAGYYRQEQEWSSLDVSDIDRILRPALRLKTIQTILTGLRRHQAVSIDYWPKDLESGSITVRAISPNHLVFADNRYHVRAYCHLRNYYLDFVLSRILSAQIANDIDWVSSREDKEWNESVTMYFRPNPELAQSVQQAVLRNYEDEEEAGMRIIKCRKALGFYVERKLCKTKSEKYQMPLWVLDKAIQ